MLFYEQKNLITNLTGSCMDRGTCWGIQSSVYGTKTKNKKVATLKVPKFYLDLYKYTQKLLVPVPIETDVKCPQRLLG